MREAPGGARLRWGIMGAGIVARRMAGAIAVHDDSELLWISSQDSTRAKLFATEMQVPAWGTYDEMLHDGEVNIVYVATTNNLHARNARSALAGGKHVILEKPFTVNAREANDLMDLAARKSLFLMEGMWTRFLPLYQQLRTVIGEGRIGAIRLLNVPFGKYADPRYLPRLRCPQLAGGAMLDMGGYAISFCCFLTGCLPNAWGSVCRFSPEYVDELAAYQLSFPAGEIAQICTGYAVNLERRAAVYGTQGYVIFPDFPFGSRFTLCNHDGTNYCLRETEIKADPGAHGFLHELREVSRCISLGLTESPLMPWHETLGILKVMDSMRADWSLSYPCE